MTVASTRTYATLDGLRGVAAIAVLLYHAPAFFGDAVPAGYLAVDLFFVLSGFVLAHAYGPRFQRGMSAADFMVTRLIRLYPMYLAGTVFGLTTALLGILAFPGGATLRDIVQAAIPALLMLPSVLPERPHVYPLNGPAWSLMLELVVNLVHVLLWRRLSKPFLISWILIWGAVLAVTAWRFGSLDIGWSWSNLLGGLPRVMFSYFVGVLIYEMYRGERRVSPFALAICLVVLAAFVSHRDGVGQVYWALFGFPAVIMLGVRFEPGPRAAKLCGFLGRISFPLYAIHWPVIEAFTRLTERVGVPDASKPFIGAGVVILIVVLSHLAVRFYDEPARAWLQKMRKRHAVG